MYFDTHAHYDDARFDEDRDEVISSLAEAGVELVVDVGSDVRSSEFACELAEKYPFFYFAAGIHPHETENLTDADLYRIEELTGHPKCVAIGEIGLDYYYDGDFRDTQIARFHEQLCLARKVGKPVIIHERDACADVLAEVTQFPDIRGVYHCFSGSVETAKIILKQGWYLSFTGVITFKNARKAPEVVKIVPDDRIMLETDCPYLAPVPVRGTRNDSRNLAHTCAKAAEYRGVTAEALAKQTLENGKRFFGIK